MSALRAIGAVLAAWLAVGCTSGPEETGLARALGPLPHAPTGKQALQALLRNHDVPLAVDPSCRGVGTSQEDGTLGDYASGFLAELRGGRNEIATSCEAGARVGDVVETWRCEIEWRHQSDDDEWAWGVRFALRAADGMLVPGSVRCIGGG